MSTMKLLDFITAEATLEDLQAADKGAAISELLDALVRAGRIAEEDKPSVLDALMKREELGSTGIGRGVAIPHTKHEAVSELVGVLGRSRAGLDFRSLDGEPAHLFFLIISPVDRPNEHLHALEEISFLVRDDSFSRFMKEASDKQALNDLLREADEKWFS